MTWDLPGGPLVANLPPNARDEDLTPGHELRAHTCSGQLSARLQLEKPGTTGTEPLDLEPTPRSSARPR